MSGGMTLYYSDVLAPRKVCAAAKYLGVDVDYVYLDLTAGEQKAPSYMALNPNGTVPTLTDGERVIWEADAIMCHLSDRAGSEFWPHDGRQIDVIRWLSWSAQHFTRCGGALYFEYVIKARFGMGGPDEAEVAEALGSWRRFAGVLDRHLAGRSWLVGDAPTVADFSVGVALGYAGQTPFPVEEFPQVRGWNERLHAIEAWRDPFPAR